MRDILLRRRLLLIAAFLVVDLVLAGLHLGHALARQGVADLEPLFSTTFSLAQDHGLAEQVEYAMSAAIVATLGIGAARRREPILASLAAAHLLMLADNALRIHERAGEALGAAGLPPMLGLQAHHLGELVYFAGVGLPMAGALVLGWLRSGPEARRMAWPVLLATAASAVFGVGADAVLAATALDQASLTLRILVEDGGELVALSLACALTLALALAGELARPYGRSWAAR